MAGLFMSMPSIVVRLSREAGADRVDKFYRLPIDVGSPLSHAFQVEPRPVPGTAHALRAARPGDPAHCRMPDRAAGASG